MSLLPGQIIPQTVPLGRVGGDGAVTIDKNWWLFFYNLALRVLGSGTGFPADALQDLEGADTDAIDADAIALRRPIENLNLLLDDIPADPPDLSQAILLAQDGLLPDPVPQASLAQAIVVSGSPFAYTAPANGTVVISGGVVSDVSLIRQTATVETGVIVGVFPVSRLDQVQVTYTGTPTMTFLPT